MKPSDIFVVDRGFRDSIDLLEELGIQAEIPAFMKRGEKQMAMEEANASRLVTKVNRCLISWALINYNWRQKFSTIHLTLQYLLVETCRLESRSTLYHRTRMSRIM